MCKPAGKSARSLSHKSGLRRWGNGSQGQNVLFTSTYVSGKHNKDHTRYTTGKIITGKVRLQVCRVSPERRPLALHTGWFGKGGRRG